MAVGKPLGKGESMKEYNIRFYLDDEQEKKLQEVVALMASKGQEMAADSVLQAYLIGGSDYLINGALERAQIVAENM